MLIRFFMNRVLAAIWSPRFRNPRHSFRESTSPPNVSVSALVVGMSVLFIAFLTEFDKHSFSAGHFPGHCFGPIPAPGSFAASAFPVPPERHRSLPQSTRSLWEQRPLASECPRKMGQEKGEKFMSYLYVKWNSFGLRFARRRFGH